MLLVPDVGEVRLLEYVRARLNSGNIRIGLFASSHMPAAADVLSTYTAIEATFPGYATAETANWSVPAPDGTGRQFTQADFQVWTRGVGGSPESIFGYFIWDADSGDLLWAEADPNAPVPINSSGNTYTVRPRLTDRSEP